MIKEDMNKYSSEHYDFYFFRESVAERDINSIAKLQEDCYKKICEVLNIKPEIRIQYYLINNRELVGEIYGDNEPCNGFAKPPNEIYAVYNDDIKCVGYHEDAHILSYTINIPNSFFIKEGLAMYFDKSWGIKTNEEWVRHLLIGNKYINLRELFDNSFFMINADSITYPIAGAFTRFLIDTFGIEKYLLLYKAIDDDFLKTIKEIYLKEIEEIELDFLLSLK